MAHTSATERPRSLTAATALEGTSTIAKIRAAAYVCATVGVLMVTATVAAANATLEQALAITIMGGTLAVTPYMIARALEEFINDRR